MEFQVSQDQLELDNWIHRKVSYELKALHAHLPLHPQSCAVLPTPLPPLVSPSLVVIPRPSLPLGRWQKSIGNNRWEMIVFLGGISEISRRPCSYYMTNECCFPSLHSDIGSIIEPGLGQLWYWFSFVISDSLLK